MDRRSFAEAPESVRRFSTLCVSDRIDLQCVVEPPTMASLDDARAAGLALCRWASHP